MLGDLGLPDDGYDYSRHIRAPGDGIFLQAVSLPSSQHHGGNKGGKGGARSARPAPSSSSGPASSSSTPLPSVLFASDKQVRIPMLDRLAPGLENIDLDLLPEDIVDVLVGNEDPDGELEDDFVALAGGFASDDDDDSSDQQQQQSITKKAPSLRAGGTLSDEEEAEEYSTDCDFDDMPPLESLPTASKKGQSHDPDPDRDFEQFIEDEYQDDEIGELDGGVGIEGKYRPQLDANGRIVGGDWVPADLQLLNPDSSEGEADGKLRETVKALAQKYVDKSSGDEGPEYEVVEVSRKPQFDCESILSTYTNTEHHPQMIAQPREIIQVKLSHKTGIPVGIMKKHRAEQKRGHASAAQQDSQSGSGPEGGADSDDQDAVNSGAKRPDAETAESKRERKKQVKEEKRLRRQEKKTAKIAFKREEQRQARVATISSVPRNRTILKL